MKHKKSVKELVGNGVQFRRHLNAIELRADITGSSREERFDWVACRTAYLNVLADLAIVVGDEHKAEKLINSNLN